MHGAINLAGRGVGLTAPNPAVGCVIVNDWKVVGRGWTQPAGGGHAESIAITNAGPLTKGSTLYVSLEPCCHHGKTAPCTDAIINAGIRKVVFSVNDPDPRVSGKGEEALKNAGIKVCKGVLAKEAYRVNYGFFKRLGTGLPLFSLKFGATNDGRLTMEQTSKRWITGSIARRFGHMLRSTHDAIIVGSKTANIDNPQLDCRLGGNANHLSHQPIRIVLDKSLLINENSTLVKTANELAPTWVFTSAMADKKKIQLLQEKGVKVIVCKTIENHIFCIEVATYMGRSGLNSALIEGGGQIAASFFTADLIDRIYSIRAPSFSGEDGIPSVGRMRVLIDDQKFTRTDFKVLGNDVLEILERKVLN